MTKSLFLNIVAVSLLLPLTSLYSLSAEDKSIYKKLEANLKGQAEFVKKKVWRSKEKSNTVELESFIAREIDVPTTKEILSDTPKYKEWALRNINVRPGGGNYRIRVKDLIADKANKSHVTLHYAVDIPMFNLTGQRKFNVVLSPTADRTHIEAIAFPKEKSIVKHMEVSLKIFKSKYHSKQAWMYLRAFVTLNSRLLYEALPQKLLNNEFNRRISRILDNYIEEENRRFSLDP